jgi:hypothetical protein
MTSPSPWRTRLAPLLALPPLLLLAWLAYRPGLSGGFLFDDYVNLDALGRYGPVRDLDGLLRYVTSGAADPTGRPLSLLSFLVDARGWPAEPGPFLRTNLLLHLLNGALLFVLLARLGRVLGDAPSRAGWIAIAASGFWLLHPLLVSTTLYAVQREAMLPATFVLLGLIAYVAGRERLEASAGRRGLGWIVLGLVGGTLLATACKANGILLPLLAGVLEFTVFTAAAVPASPGAAPRRRLVRLALGLGAVAIAALLATYLPRLGEVPAGRAWTIGERLLTEPRVLLDYLQLVAVPRSVSTGLYNDSFDVSRSFGDPASTLPALAAIVVLLAACVALRRRAPALSAAGLFFFAGHLLESTVVPLELYFEHRNYLPMLLLGWPLARAIAAWRAAPAWRVAATITLWLLLASITWQRASLWGQPDRLAALWLVKSPHSARAVTTIASELIRRGEAGAAEQALANAARERPDSAQVVFAYAQAACASRRFDRRHDAAVATVLARTRAEQQLVFQWLADAHDIAGLRACRGWNDERVAAWVALAAANPHLVATASGRQNLHLLRGRAALARGDAATGIAELEAALRERVHAQVALGSAALLATHGRRADAIAHLDLYEALAATAAAPAGGMPRVHAWVLARQRYWPGLVDAMRAQLAEPEPDAPASGSGPR